MNLHFRLLLLLNLIILPRLSAQEASAKLDSVIQNLQDHDGYEKSDFPLGNFSEEYYEQEADFARQQLKELEKVTSEGLSETEQISRELLRYKLQETIDFYDYGAYLNPLLSDSGFHVSLPYQVRDLSTYQQVKNYLNKLNALPAFVDQHFALLREGIEKGK